MDGAHIGRDVILGSGFRASGTSASLRATIGGSLNYEDAIYDAS